MTISYTKTVDGKLRSAPSLPEEHLSFEQHLGFQLLAALTARSNAYHPYELTAAGSDWYFDYPYELSLISETEASWFGFTLRLEVTNLNALSYGSLMDMDVYSRAMDPYMSAPAKVGTWTWRLGSKNRFAAHVFISTQQGGKNKILASTPTADATPRNPPFDGVVIRGLPSGYQPIIYPWGSNEPTLLKLHHKSCLLTGRLKE